ncbi:MAG: mannosyl-glycoprotein endo-beta-n-acetylglucosaminidase [Myxococcaceae bacterium]|nr:mannosyl-glycoprotein endo-beta-n-acetylglucosaminidase [Myxococcaceae bacterium]
MSLRVGSSGESVRALQQRLLQAGFDPGGVDGQFGGRTKAAVERFQQQKGLTVDGIAGNQTMRAFAGESTFEPAPTAPGAATTAQQAGIGHKFKQFREIDEAKLRAALPAQAQHLAKDFIDAGRANNIDPLTLVAISKHETASWTSSAFRNKNNAMGISSSSGPRRFDSASQSIAQMARGLAKPDGYYRNATTIQQLWGIYAPGPATGQGRQTNDPNNLNRSWGPAIVRNIQSYERAVL